MNAYARSTDPVTSQIAGAKVDAAYYEAQVLQALSAIGPATTQEISEFLDIRYSTITPRMKPLEEKGWVRRFGVKMGDRGRNRIVWARVQRPQQERSK